MNSFSSSFIITAILLRIPIYRWFTGSVRFSLLLKYISIIHIIIICAHATPSFGFTDWIYSLCFGRQRWPSLILSYDICMVSAFPYSCHLCSSPIRCFHTTSTRRIRLLARYQVSLPIYTYLFRQGRTSFAYWHLLWLCQFTTRPRFANTTYLRSTYTLSFY